jgi:hypothetical protein
MVLPNILKFFNPRTNKFEFGLHPCGIWYNSMGDEVGWVCSLCNLPKEVTHDLLIKNTNNSQCLKNEMTFAFLTKVSSHMQVAMVDEINNLHELNAILHGVNIGQ